MRNQQRPIPPLPSAPPQPVIGNYPSTNPYGNAAGVAPACNTPPSTPYPNGCGTVNPPQYYAPDVQFYSAGTPPQISETTLELSDVMRLVEAGVDDQVIVLFISRRQLEKRLTVDDLISLTKNQVSPTVINELQRMSVAFTKPALKRGYPPVSESGSSKY